MLIILSIAMIVTRNSLITPSIPFFFYLIWDLSDVFTASPRIIVIVWSATFDAMDDKKAISSGTLFAALVVFLYVWS